MAFNSGGANPMGVKTGPRPEDAYVPPVSEETLGAIEKAADKGTDVGQMKREGVVGTIPGGEEANPRTSRISEA
jgi:hypothetical protein